MLISCPRFPGPPWAVGYKRGAGQVSTRGRDVDKADGVRALVTFLRENPPVRGYPGGWSAARGVLEAGLRARPGS